MFDLSGEINRSFEQAPGSVFAAQFADFQNEEFSLRLQFMDSNRIEFRAGADGDLMEAMSCAGDVLDDAADEREGSICLLGCEEPAHCLSFQLRLRLMAESPGPISESPGVRVSALSRYSTKDPRVFSCQTQGVAHNGDRGESHRQRRPVRRKADPERC